VFYLDGGEVSGQAKGIQSDISVIDDMAWLCAKINAEGMNDFQYRVESRFRSWGEGLVQAFATHA
jgi:hypothetical protein